LTDLISQIGSFGEDLKRRFALEFEKDPPAFKQLVLCALSKAFVLKRGRRPESNITLAADLRAQGKEWREIYPLCIKNYPTLCRNSQRIEEENLRAAVRSRRNAQKRRTSARV
jgi:hypothetical protein